MITIFFFMVFLILIFSWFNLTQNLNQKQNFYFLKIIGLVAAFIIIVSFMPWSYFPGVKLDGFDVSFWAGLYSGFLYSIVTGIFVGLFVWWIQQTIEKKRLVKSNEKEIVIMAGKLRFILLQEHSTKIDSMVKSIPENSKLSIELVSNYPLTYWVEIMSNFVPFLNLIIQLQSTYENIFIIAHKIDNQLALFARETNSSKGLIIQNDIRLIIYCVGRINEFEPLLIMPWIEGSVENIERFEEFYSEFIKVIGVDELVIDYKNTNIKINDLLLETKKKIANGFKEVS